MIRRMHVVSLVFALTLLLAQSSLCLSGPPIPPGVARLMQSATGPVDITFSGWSAYPTFVRGTFELSPTSPTPYTNPSTAALGFVIQYADSFGVTSVLDEISVGEAQSDSLGMTHVKLNQVYRGIEVFGTQIGVHLSADMRHVVAVASTYVPGIHATSVTPRLNPTQAVAHAQKAMPQSQPLSKPRLVIYPGPSSHITGSSAKLAWLIELRDDSGPTRVRFVIDANTGVVIDTLDLLYTQRNRRTYNANHTTNLPGVLVRSEGQGPTNDPDADRAHDFAGATYDYFSITHHRDSYDNAGALLVSSVHYGHNYANAFWNGSQMVYGDGFPVKDVAAHELTHAVTEHTANLEYDWQSGALNESFSDIFGTMVDRDDWLLGEDLPPDTLGGRDAIRDLSNPSRLGQPDHTQDWVQTCSDNQGVHTNSGITNKAFYNIATAIGKAKAEIIFYRALTAYLQSRSSLEDARAAFIQSAQDYYGANSAEYTAVRNGLNAVGLDGAWQPPNNTCTCAATTALSDQRVSDQPDALQAIMTLYRVRDQVLNGSLAGDHYRDLYYRHTAQIAALLVRDSELMAAGAQILISLTPGLGEIVDGANSDVIVTRELVDDMISYLNRLAEADRSTGDGQLAKTIEEEMARIEWDHLVGMTYDEAWAYVQDRISTVVYSAYLPIIAR